MEISFDEKDKIITLQTPGECKVTISDKDESIEISIAYTIKSSNTQFNMVFPFYYEGGLRF